MANAYSNKRDRLRTEMAEGATAWGQYKSSYNVETGASSGFSLGKANRGDPS
jgi:hypothetical protein